MLAARLGLRASPRLTWTKSCPSQRPFQKGSGGGEAGGKGPVGPQGGSGEGRVGRGGGSPEAAPRSCRLCCSLAVWKRSVQVEGTASAKAGSWDQARPG